jgi:hypothetical protein
MVSAHALDAQELVELGEVLIGVVLQIGDGGLGRRIGLRLMIGPPVPAIPAGVAVVVIGLVSLVAFRRAR